MICPICNSDKKKEQRLVPDKHGEVIFSEKQYSCYICKECGSLFSKYVYSESSYILSNFYKSNIMYLSQFGNFMKSFYSRLKYYSGRKRYLAISTVLKKTNNKLELLEIGCGKGHFISQIPSEKFNKSVIEHNTEVLKSFLANDVSINEGDFETYEFDKKYDVICSFHSLEHMPRPKQIITKVNNLLNQNGIFALIVPNTESFGWIYTKSNWFHLDFPRHVCIPSKTGLISMLEDDGFEILKVSNPYHEYPFDIFYSIKSKFLRCLILPFMPILKIISSETIFIIARKK